MKKIALLHFAYPPATGGVEILLQEHALVLTQLGYQVSIFTGSGEEKDPQIKLTVIPEFQSVMNFNPTLQEKILEKGVIDEEFYQTAKIIGQKLESLLVDQDVIIVHNMLTIVRNLPFIEAFRHYVPKHPEKKFIAWVHDHSYIHEFKIKELAKVVHSDIEKKLLTTPIDQISYVTISETFKKPLVELMNLPSEKVVVIPGGVLIDKFLELDESVAAMAEDYRLLESFPLLLSPVNILDRKNLDYCLEIVANLKKTYPKVCYLVTGNVSRHQSTVEYLQKLKTLIDKLGLKENVFFLSDHFHRYLKPSEIHDLYELSDIVLFISKSENFGLPLVESALSKTPIFVSDLAVFKEIAGNYVNYINYKTTSPQQAAALIKSFIEKNPYLAAHYHVRTNYSLKRILETKLVPLLGG
ncbi:MAG: glycosyltransferase family 4 protein [Microgenomates group bacterium]